MGQWATLEACLLERVPNVSSLYHSNTGFNSSLDPFLRVNLSITHEFPVPLWLMLSNKAENTSSLDSWGSIWFHAVKYKFKSEKRKVFIVKKTSN